MKSKSLSYAVCQYYGIETGDNSFTSTTGIEVDIQDKFDFKVTASWGEVAPILRTLFQQELDGFFHEKPQRESVHLEGQPTYQVGDQVTIPTYGCDPATAANEMMLTKRE